LPAAQRRAAAARARALAAGRNAAGQANTAAGGSNASTDPSALGTDPTGELVSNLAPVSLPTQKAPVPLLFYIAAVLALLLVLFGPPALAVWLRRDRPKP